MDYTDQEVIGSIAYSYGSKEWHTEHQFHLQNVLSWLSVPMHGIVLQMLEFLFFILQLVTVKVALCVVTVLLEYLTDRSIRVSQSCIMVSFGVWVRMCVGRGGTCPPCLPPLGSATA